MTNSTAKPITKRIGIALCGVWVAFSFVPNQLENDLPNNIKTINEVDYDAYLSDKYGIRDYQTALDTPSVSNVVYDFKSDAYVYDLHEHDNSELLFDASSDNVVAPEPVFYDTTEQFVYAPVESELLFDASKY